MNYDVIKKGKCDHYLPKWIIQDIMAKKGLDIATISSVLLCEGTWSLCIGAGTSRPLLPDWYALVDTMISQYCPKEKIDIDNYKKYGFSADAMIQAVRNHLKVNDHEYVKLLSDEIYRPIKEMATDTEWKSFIKIHNNRLLTNIRKNEWSDFESLLAKGLEKVSANNLAKVVIKAIANKVEPRSILTFNGEDVFLSLLNYYYWTKCSRENNKDKFDRVVNSIHVPQVGKIPYVHCHGVLPINEAIIQKGYNAEDKLVFLEESYLRLVDSPISWQALQFIENCLLSKMVFVGVSLTDPNMRHWLGWIHSNKLKELHINGIKAEDATEHFWINKKPVRSEEKIWIEESVAHLGVRLVWIDDWNQVGEVLEKMLGV